MNMPTLYHAKKKKIWSEKAKKEERLKREEIYFSSEWRKIRQAYLREHPVCEFCNRLGIVKPAMAVHHKDGFNNYTGEDFYNKAYDYNNLVSLCNEHHSFLHRNGRTHGLEWDIELREWEKRKEDNNKYISI